MKDNERTPGEVNGLGIGETDDSAAARKKDADAAWQSVLAYLASSRNESSRRTGGVVRS